MKGKTTGKNAAQLKQADNGSTIDQWSHHHQ
jgi:hypothetical protein